MFSLKLRARDWEAAKFKTKLPWGDIHRGPEAAVAALRFKCRELTWRLGIVRKMAVGSDGCVSGACPKMRE